MDQELLQKIGLKMENILVNIYSIASISNDVI